MKKIFKRLFSVLVLAAVIVNNRISFAGTTDNILFESTEQEIISSGITYKKDTRLTEAGWIDVHIIEADLTNPYVKLDVIRDTDGYGLKDSLTSLAKKNNVIAAVNADFFNMRKNPTDTIGFEYEKDGIVVGKHNFNMGGNSYGSLFLDSNNLPFIDFMKMSLLMTSEDGEKKLYFNGFNQITAIPEDVICFDKHAMNDTAEIDKRFPRLCKMIIQDNVVTYLSTPGELITIPQDGLIMVMNEEIAFYVYKNFPVGTKTVFNTNTNIDLASINLAVSGGGKVVSQGVVSNEGYVVDRKRRHPRTAIGYNQNRDKLYMVVVDGRGSSIGATHEELGKILIDNGIYNAIHLDGGGSSTLVARHLGNSNVNVFNRPSGGVQRRIPNGIGLTSTAPISDLHEIKITANKTRTFKDMPIEFSVIGYDKYYNPVEVDINNLIWKTVGINGRWEGNKFYPQSEGKGTVEAYVNGISGGITVQSTNEPISLEINNKFSSLEPGESTNLKILGIDKDGYRGEVNTKNVTWEVENKNIGHFSNGQFIASNNLGQSLIKGTIGNTTVYGYVIVNKETGLIDSFENDTKTHTTVHPETVTAATEVIDEAHKGNNSIKFSYGFKKSTNTQAAYLEFDKPYTFNKKLNKIGLWVDGNSVNHWLRGRITDADGNQKLLTFSHAVDWTGWKYVTADIPSNIKYPITLDRIYIASLHCPQDDLFELKFDDLTAHYSFDTSGLSLPQEQIYDPLGKKTLENPQMKISVFGSTGSKNTLLDTIVQREVLRKMEEISDVSLFVGKSDIPRDELDNDVVTWNNQYKVTDYENVRIINLATSKNSMRLTDPNQWKTFVNDLNNTKQKHIFITLDKNPLLFSDKREAKLFCDVIKKVREEKDKNIFVINGSGYDFNVEYVEGIRYMDINGLWYKVHGDSKVDLNDRFYIINFNINADDISYSVTNVYPK